MEQEKKYKSFWSSLFNWKLDEEELKNQIENYNTLNFFNSLRKISSGLFILSTILTTGYVLLGYISVYAMFDALIFLVLAILIYRGKHWALVLAMIFWTFEKYYDISSGGSNTTTIVWAIIWWAVYMSFFWKAYQLKRKETELVKII